jgi:hypothetical protein
VIRRIVDFDNRIRVGTFNVNGKMPSQDLASWVGGRSVEKNDANGKEDGERLLPPLRRLSSLSLGEIGTDSATINSLFYHRSLASTSTYIFLPHHPSRICTVRNRINQYGRIFGRAIFIVNSHYQ